MEVDPELLGIFLAETREQCQTMEEVLLRLEDGTASAEDVAGMFRAAHSLKGSARLLGAVDLIPIAHHLETWMDGLRQVAHPRITGRQAGAVHAALQALLARLASPGLLTEDAAWRDRQLAHLEGGGSAEPPEMPLAEDPIQASEPEAGTGAEARPPAPGTGTAEEAQVLVPARRLDDLLALTGELVAFQDALRLQGARARDWADSLEEAGPRGAAGADATRAAAFAGALEDSRHRLSMLLQQLEGTVRDLRLVPLEAVFKALQFGARDLARTLDRNVRFTFDAGRLEVDKRLADGLKAPLLHLIRNALDHGMEAPATRLASGKPPRGHIQLRASRDGGALQLDLEDDGPGVDLEAVRAKAVAGGLLTREEAAQAGPRRLLGCIFLPGFSTRTQATEISGRGVGLDLVRVWVESLRGTVEVDSTPGAGTRFRLRLPLDLATIQSLLVEAGGARLAVPSAVVRACLRTDRSPLKSSGGAPTLAWNGEALPWRPLAEALSAAPSRSRLPAFTLVVDTVQGRRAYGVDEVWNETQVLEHPLPARLRHLKGFSGWAQTGDGGLCLVVGPGALSGLPAPGALPSEGVQAGPPPQPRILVVDDALTTRVQIRRILESQGYAVVLAVDGEDAWTKLASGRFDAVVSDVEMPRLDGLGLTRRIRLEPRFGALPVILVTSLAQEGDRQRGLEAGAQAYIPKSSFDQADLLQALKDLL